MACVSSNVRRTFHVPSGVRVQRSISGRDVSHPVTSRSGLLTFFSSLVIQECLINFAEIIRSANDLEFNKSKKNSHCELFFVFCLSASHPSEVEFAIAEMACVSSNVRRTFHVPSGVRVQRSISRRDVSHPRMVFYFCFRILIGCLGILGLLRRRMVVVSHLFHPQRF